MGLSENEQRILDQLENQLRDEDPRLARRASRMAKATSSTRAIVRAAAMFVVGFGLLLLLTLHLAFGILGAALMLVGLVQGARSVTDYARAQALQARQKANSDEL